MGGPGSGMKKGTKIRRGRRNSTFLTRTLVEINNEIRDNYAHITGADKVWQTYKKVTPTEAEECFNRFKGRCAYCDKALSYLGRKDLASARLAWYVPLNVGGEARPDNLIVICFRCKNNYTSTRKLREDVVGLDSFADVVELLVKAVKEGKDQTEIDRLKDKLNVRLSDVATCMRYVTTSDWKPDKFVKVVEGENTIGEQVEQLIKGEGTKEDITQTVKQIVTTKKYTILKRKPDED